MIRQTGPSAEGGGPSAIGPSGHRAFGKGGTPEPTLGCESLRFQRGGGEASSRRGRGGVERVGMRPRTESGCALVERPRKNARARCHPSVREATPRQGSQPMLRPPASPGNNGGDRRHDGDRQVGAVLMDPTKGISRFGPERSLVRVGGDLGMAVFEPFGAFYRLEFGPWARVVRAKALRTGVRTRCPLTRFSYKSHCEVPPESLNNRATVARE